MTEVNFPTTAVNIVTQGDLQCRERDRCKFRRANNHTRLVRLTRTLGFTFFTTRDHRWQHHDIATNSRMATINIPLRFLFRLDHQHRARRFDCSRERPHECLRSKPRSFKLPDYVCGEQKPQLTARMFGVILDHGRRTTCFVFTE